MSYSKIQKLITSLIISASFAFGLLVISPISTFAQAISLEPISIDRSNKDERGWFLYNVKPGSVIEDTLVVRNNSGADTTVELNANDATVTTDGTFSPNANQTPNTALGSWITLSQKTLAIGGSQNIGVPFTINVPKDVKNGEYAGALSAIIANNETSQNGVGANIRIAVRMYLTVNDESEEKGQIINTQITSTSIANPTKEDFVDKVRARGTVNADNMGLYIKAQELGNIYSKSVSKAKITTPDGNTKTLEFTRSFSPNVNPFEYYIETGIPYQAGETKVELEYTSAPFINNKNDLEVLNNSGTLEYVMNLTEQDIQTIKDTVAKVSKESGQVSTQPKASSSQNSNFTITAPEEKKEDSSNSLILGILIGVIVLLVVALVIVLILNKKKSKSIGSNK